jgi:uncharacterized protein (TIGR02996 family)
MPSLEERAFLRRILDHPAVDGPRLIYADWLDERGDSRGEFIRLQCAIAALDRDDPTREDLQLQELALLEPNEKAWTGILPSWVIGHEFSRGFVEAVTVEASGFLREGHTVFDLTPIRKVRLVDARDRLGEIAQSPLLRRIRELDLCGNYLGNGGPNILGRSPYLDHLEVLDLSFNELTNRGCESLAQIRSLRNLKRLHLNDNSGIDTPGIRHLSDSPFLANVRVLDLSGNDLNESSICTLFNGSSLKKLEQLQVSGNRIGDGGVRALTNSPILEQILNQSPRLDLSKNQIGPLGGQYLGAAPILNRIEVLDLSGNPLTDAGLRSLAESQFARNLRILRLANTHVTDAGLLDLWDLVLLHSLEEIDLTGNVITASTVNALQDAALERDWRKQVVVKADKTYLSRTVRRRRF